MFGKALRAPCTRGLLRPTASMPSRGIKAFTHDPLTSDQVNAAVNKLQDEEPARLAMLRDDYTLDDEQIALVEKDRAVELKEREEFGPLGDPRKMGTHDNYFEEMMNKPAGDPTSRFFTYAVTGGAYATSMIATKSILNRMGKYFWMNPYMVEQGTVEVDFAHLSAGDTMAVNWRGKCVYIKYRTDAEIEQARADDGSDDLKDPEPDSNRVERPEVLIVSGVCTHLGCVPLPNEGDYPGGFFCPCHGSHYDNSGRIRKGPAPLNLEVPPYKFLGDSALQLG